MILTENRRFLAKEYPHIWDVLQSEELQKDGYATEVVASQSGHPTLLWNEGGAPFYIHSRYNPVQEAEKLIEKYQDVSRYKHVLFYGIGLGYHVNAFLKLYPHLQFTMYEPDADVFYQYVSTRLMHDLPLDRLKKLYVEGRRQDHRKWVQDFVATIKEEVLIVVLPSYERKDPQKFKQFCEVMKEAVHDEKISLQVNISFEKRWVVNSIMNLPYTLKTPSIFSKREYFQCKPAIIVSAGPSLEEEIERLKAIKEQGTAYIFAVGSANKALINNGIMPDAVCTYDPLPWNFTVIQDIKKRGITTIPLIFGSTVGYETLTNYPGPMLHMLISQDSVSPLLLIESTAHQLNIVEDAPSIAIVTMELLHKLGCDPIILVGQNLALKNNQFYSKGIVYGYRNEQANENELKHALPIKDVTGQTILSNESFNSMRKSMERLITKFHMKNVINTTQGGAHIEGTSFESLEEVMMKRLQGGVVDADAFQSDEFEINRELIESRKMQLIEEYEALAEVVGQFGLLLEEISQHLRDRKKAALDKDFVKLNEPLKRMEANLFYNHIIRPLNRVQQELLFREMDGIRKDTNPFSKAEKILQHFGSYMINCRQDMQSAYRLIQEKTSL